MKWLLNIDKKVDPTFGKKMYLTFKITFLILFFLGIPLITLGMGAASIGTNVVDSVAIYSTIIPYLVLFFISLIGWFYFSKWND